MFVSVKSTFVLIFCLCSATVKVQAGKKITTGQFVHMLRISLDSPDKMTALGDVYENVLYGEVAFTDSKPLMNYFLLQSDLEKRQLPDKILADYKKRKKKFKQRLSLVPKKINMMPPATLNCFIQNL